MSAPDPFAIGDALPPLALPLADGRRFDLSAPGLAGRARVLVLDQVIEDARLSAAQRIAMAHGAALLLVSGRRPDGGRPDLAPPHLFDADRRIFAGLGLPRGGVAVIGARGALAFVATGENALERALASLPPMAPARILRGGLAPVLVVPDVLEPAFSARIVAAAGESALPLALQAGFRQRLERRVLPELWRAFGFRPGGLLPPRIVREASGVPAGPSPGRFALRLVLEAGDHDGGALRFPEYGPDAYDPPPGAALIHGSLMLAEMQPVTRGARWVVQTAFTDASP